MVSGLFHRPSGLLFTFPSRYLFTIGLLEYLVLPVSSGGFPQAFRVPGYLRIETKKTFYFHLRGYHPLGPSFPAHSTNKKFFDSSAINGTFLPCNPQCIATLSLDYLRFRSPLLTECIFVYFPPGTEMFYFPGYASHIKCEITKFYLVGFPHSDIFGSKVARHLPEAYRRHAASFIASMSKASTIRP